MIRRFWTLYAVALSAWTAIVMAATFGPAVELAIAPIRAEQAVDEVERLADRVCWRWSSLKLRPAISDDVDVFIFTGGDKIVGSVYARDTGAPWRRSGSVAAGPQVTRLCAPLPPHVPAGAPIRIEMTIAYHGWHDFWTLRVATPAIEVPPA